MQVFFCEYCKIFKNSFFIEDLLIIPFRNFYLMIDIDILGLYFITVKLGQVTEKDFALDRSKLVFRYLIISVL